MTLKLPLSPPLYDTLQSFKREMLIEINCVKPGKIVTYYPDTQTADVSVGLAQVLQDNSNVAYPKLVDCPVMVLQGGGIAARFPISTGDNCLIFFSDRCIDDWYTNGGANPPPDGRLHDLSDGFVLVGLNPLNAQLSLALDDVEGGISDEFAKVAISDGHVTIRNNLTNLLTRLEDLIDVIKAITTTGGDTVSATSQAALEAQKALLEQLLY